MLTISDSLQFDWSDADLDVQGESLLSPVGNESMTHPSRYPAPVVHHSRAASAHTRKH